jgi:predicted Zn-dependent protease
MDILHYLVLTDFHDEQPVDIATGHLNVRADLLVYRDHELQGAVQGVPLSMPLADFLGAVVEISSDQARYSEVDACSLVLEGIKLPS